jgi:hypothetical protein
VQKTKEMGAKGRRMGVWIRTLGSTPCLWWCSGAETESPRISYVRRPIGLGNVVMIASGPVIPAER